MPYRQYSHEEWWPVIRLNKDSDEENFFGVAKAEFTDEELSEIHQLERDFEKWQIKMAERFGVEPPTEDFVLDEQD